MKNTPYFENKIHQRRFIYEWKKACHSVKNKKRYVKEIVKKSKNSHSSIEEKERREEPWLTAAHHVLYNILMGKPYYTGFTLTSNRKKVIHQQFLTVGLYHAVHKLNRIQKLIKELDNRDKVRPDYYYIKASFREVDDFFAPFAVSHSFKTDDMLKLELPNLEPLYGCFGSGVAVAKRILNGDLPNMAEVYYSNLELKAKFEDSP